MDWSARQYVKFEDERTRPARNLLDAVPTRDALRATDLGCGPGNSTELILERYPEAVVSGVDSSPDMIEEARRRLPRLRFEVGDIASWAPPEPQDLIFANAVLQWLPDHATLLPRLAGALTHGGSLAIQMPDNLDEPSHRAMREAARSGPWAERLAAADVTRTGIASPVAYYAMLKPHAQRVDVWRTVYHHPLDGASAIVEWFKGTGLRPYLARLSETERSDYVARYQALITKAYPEQPDGKVLLAFPRLFIVATR